MSKRFGLTLLLRDDPAGIAEYRRYHTDVWPEVTAELRAVGIERMFIYLLGRQLFQFIETTDAFEPTRDLPRLNDNPRYAEWDRLMRTMQEKVDDAKPGDWWAPMDEVFDLEGSS
ncbi:MAG: L-rhamnose mutarotase [Gaiellaceae bacterium]